MRRVYILVNTIIPVALCALLMACRVSPEPPGLSDYTLWKEKGQNAKEVQAFDVFLKNQRVDRVVPLYQLLRSDVRWKKCHAEPFDVPQRSLWPHMVPTLKLIQNEIKPVVGNVEALSVFRSPAINHCVGGASRSFHLQFHAVDMRPVKNIGRKRLIEKLCRLHQNKGQKLHMGLGIYSGMRFHIDSAGYRQWGDDYKAGSSPCRSLVAPQHKPR